MNRTLPVSAGRSNSNVVGRDVRAAFFDVDETLVSMKSMFVFLKYYLEKSARESDDAYDRVMASIRTQTLAGASREDVNRYFYSLFCGQRQVEVQFRARELFVSRRLTFINSTVERLRVHQDNGDHVVLVSGAMKDIISPIGDVLGVCRYRCSQPELEHGFYTGKLREQAIGKGKANLVRHYCHKYDLDLAECSAYGDHISDAYMLDVVGNAFAVRPTGDMRELARIKAWQILE